MCASCLPLRVGVCSDAGVPSQVYRGQEMLLLQKARHLVLLASPKGRKWLSQRALWNLFSVLCSKRAHFNLQQLCGLRFHLVMCLAKCSVACGSRVLAARCSSRLVTWPLTAWWLEARGPPCPRDSLFCHLERSGNRSKTRP